MRVRGQQRPGASVANGSTLSRPRKAAQQAARPIPTFGEIAKLVIADAQSKSSTRRSAISGSAISARPTVAPSGAPGERDHGAGRRRSPAADLAREARGRTKGLSRDPPRVRPGPRRPARRARDRDAGQPGIWADLKAHGFEPPRSSARAVIRRLRYSQMPEFIADLRQRDAIAARALEFLILTNVRTDAVLKATLRPVRSGARRLDGPARQPEGSGHRERSFPCPAVAPSRRDRPRDAELRGLPGVCLPGPEAGKPFSNMAMLTLLKRMNSGATRNGSIRRAGRPITAHGFRATFRTGPKRSRHSPRCRRAGDGPSSRQTSRTRI